MEVLIVVLWVVILGAVIAYCRYLFVRSRRVVRFHNRSGLSGAPRRLIDTDFDAGIAASGGMAVPIEYSTADEGFVVGVMLGKSKVYLVLDSGSQYVATATRECIEAGMCTSAKDGGYVASDAAVSHDHDQVSYGSLKIENIWTQDDIKIVGVQTPCSPTPAQILTTTWIAAAKRMIGTDSNILGLMAPYSGSKKPCFLQSVFETLGGPRVWWIRTDGGSGTLGFGRCPWDCLKRSPVTIPLASEQYLGGYIVPLQGVFARRGERWHRADVPARFALLDTGSFHSYFPQECTEGLVAAGFPCNRSHGSDVTEVSLWLGGSLEPLVLRYPPSQFGFVASNEISSILKRDDTVLLGIAHMRDAIWEFDLDNNIVRFSA